MLSVGDSRDPTAAARFFSDQVVDIPVVSTTVAGVDVQKTVTVPQLQHFDKVVDIPVMQLSTRFGRPVIMQRRHLVLRCLRFCSSPELGHSVVQQRMVLDLVYCSGEGVF